MKFFYDTEFLERGPDYPIALISIGIVREDGHSLYLVNSGAPWHEIGQHAWLMDNVVPSLPIVLAKNKGVYDASWSPGAPVYQRSEIAQAVRDFCLPPAQVAKIAGETELWGWYADYDHVVLSQLFGPMSNLPHGMPMYTRDLKQEMDLWVEEYPHQRGAVQDVIDRADARSGGIEHNALADAEQLKARYEEFANYRKRTPLAVRKR